MKILYIVNDINFFRSHRLPIALEALNKGWEVTVASNDILQFDQRIRVVKIPIDRASISIFKSLKLFFSIFFLIKKVKPRIVHNVTLKPIIIGSLVSFFFRKLIIINAVSGLGVMFTSNNFSFLKKIVLLLFRIIVLRRNTGFIFQNSIDLSVFKKIGLKKSYAIIKGSGVDADYMKFKEPLISDYKTILFTGRILKDKGVLDLINAFKLLPEKIKSKTTLRLLGDEDLENPSYIKIQDLKKTLEKDRIEWYGYSDLIKEELEQCDIYCLPSYREGLPKSIVEAMAIGRPIVTTNAPGCDDCVVEGYNGFKIDSGNVKDLSLVLLKLLKNDSLCLSMGHNSRKFFKKYFTLEIVISKTFDLYDKLLENQNYTDKDI